MMMKQQFSSPKLQQSPFRGHRKMNTKKTTKKRSVREQLLFRRKALIFVFFVFFVFSSLSLSLSDVLCGLKIVQRSLTKNSATNSLGYTTLTSYPALFSFFFIQNLYFLYPQARIRAHTRGKEVREREFREIERERESVCIYYSSFSERKEVKSNTIYNSREE